MKLPVLEVAPARMNAVVMACSPAADRGSESGKRRRGKGCGGGKRKRVRRGDRG